MSPPLLLLLLHLEKNDGLCASFGLTEWPNGRMSG